MLRHTIAAFAIAAFAMLALLACSSGTGPQGSLAVHAAETDVVLRSADTASLGVIIADADATYEYPPRSYPPPPSAPAWSAVENNVAAVSATGLVTAGAIGESWIRVSYRARVDSALVRVENASQSAEQWQQVVAGRNFSCGLLASGAAYCWGTNSLGQLGDGTVEQFTATLAPHHQVMQGPFKSIAAGGEHACAIRVAGTVMCWGRRLSHGGLPEPRPVPLEVANGSGIVALAAGVDHTCGLDASGKALCWGRNNAGQLGIGTTVDAADAQPVVTDKRFVSISAGGNHSCAVDTSALAWCWGNNGAGQLGAGSIQGSNVPVRVSSSEAFATVSAGGLHSCGLTSANRVLCWGSNSNGQLGTGDTQSRTAATAIADSQPFVSMSAGLQHNCALTAGGAAYCWGANVFGQVGDGVEAGLAVKLGQPNPYLITQPTRVVGDHVFRSIAASYGEHSCATTESAQVMCWGSNHRGQLGAGVRRTPIGRDYTVTIPFSSRPLLVIDP